MSLIFVESLRVCKKRGDVKGRLRSSGLLRMRIGPEKRKKPRKLDPKSTHDNKENIRVVRRILNAKNL